MSDKQLVFIRILFISLVFALGYMIATMMYVTSFKKKSNYLRRCIISLFLYFALAVGIAGAMYGIFMAIYDWMWYGGFKMIIYTVMMTVMQIFYFLLCYLLMSVMYVHRRMQLFYCVIAGYATWRAAASVYSIIVTVTGLRSVFGISSMQLSNFAVDVSIFLAIEFVLYLLFALIFGKKFSIIAQNYDSRLNKYTAFISVAMIVVSLLCGCVSDIYNNQVPQLDVCIHVCQIVFSVIILFIQCFMMVWLRTEKRNEVVGRMRLLGEEQLKLTKENIDIINIKVHDFKKQMALITDESFMEGVEKAISVYDSLFQTGNEALDIILTDKALRCEAKHIKFYAMVDGKALSFMPPSELNALFTNAIDNAIEYEEKVEDMNKRFISVTSSRQGAMLIVRIENYCINPPVFQKDGLPRTSKADENYHGYGTLSMKMAVETHGGVISFKAEDELFKVNVIFT